MAIAGVEVSLQYVNDAELSWFCCPSRDRGGFQLAIQSTYNGAYTTCSKGLFIKDAGILKFSYPHKEGCNTEHGLSAAMKLSQKHYKFLAFRLEFGKKFSRLTFLCLITLEQNNYCNKIPFSEKNSKVFFQKLISILINFYECIMHLVFYIYL